RAERVRDIGTGILFAAGGDGVGHSGAAADAHGVMTKIRRCRTRYQLGVAARGTRRRSRCGGSSVVRCPLANDPRASFEARIVTTSGERAALLRAAARFETTEGPRRRRATLP